MLAHILPVIRPLFLPSGSFLLSSVSKKPSSPCTSVLFAPNINSREVKPAKPMIIAEPMRHGRLGCFGGGVAEEASVFIEAKPARGTALAQIRECRRLIRKVAFGKKSWKGVEQKIDPLRSESAVVVPNSKPQPPLTSPLRLNT